MALRFVLTPSPLLQRFKRLPKQEAKVKIDKRFQKIFTDSKFSEHGSAPVDERGFKIKKKGRGGAEELRKFYRIGSDDEGDDDAEEGPKPDGGSDSDHSGSSEESGSDDSAGEEAGAAGDGAAEASSDDSSSSSSSESDEEEEGDTEPMSRMEKLNRLARGEAVLSGSESSSSDSSDDASSSEDESETDVWEDDEDIPRGDETKRLAVLNMDWTNVRAVDLLAVLRSFAPASGVVERVTVYPSEYGLQKMAEEERLGPQGVFKGPKGEDGAGDGGGLGDEDDSDDDKWRKDAVDGVVDMTALRKYEMQRMRYYFAVVECDSTATASSIYDQCDGQEFEASSNTLDLRFIPDSEKFTAKPRDSAAEVPDDYAAQEFATSALQSSNVQLTWDEPDRVRAKKLRWELSEDIRDDDFKAYLASSSGESGSESEADETKKTTKKTKGKRKGGASSDDSDGEVDVSRLNEKKRKERERIRALLLGEADDDDASGASDAEEPSKAVEKARKKSKRKKEKDEEEEGMTITFVPGLGNELIKRRQEKEAAANESVWEKSERKRREKRLAKKAEAKRKKKEALLAAQNEGKSQAAAGSKRAKHGKAESRAAVSTFSDDEVDADAMNDPFFAGAYDSDAEDTAGAKRKAPGGEDEEVRAARRAARDEERAKKAQEKKEKDRANAELALMMGTVQEAEGKAYDMKQIIEAEKLRKGKKVRGKAAKRRAAEALEAAAADTFKVDVKDTRFAALYDNPQFSIDPTHAKFKMTDTMRSILDERQQRRKDITEGESAAAGAGSGSGVDATGGAGAAEGVGVSSLVASLKRKMPRSSSTKKAPQADVNERVREALRSTGKRSKRKQGNSSRAKRGRRGSD